MDNFFDLDMAFDMSEHWINTPVSSSEIKISDSSETEETIDIYATITMMPTLQITDNEDEVNENSSSVCTVCMEGFNCNGFEGEGKIIPCGHVYHVGCIAKWLSLYSSCPLCRSVVSGGDLKMYICDDC